MNMTLAELVQLRTYGKKVDAIIKASLNRPDVLNEAKVPITVQLPGYPKNKTNSYEGVIYKVALDNGLNCFRAHVYTAPDSNGEPVLEDAMVVPLATFEFNCGTMPERIVEERLSVYITSINFHILENITQKESPIVAKLLKCVDIGGGPISDLYKTQLTELFLLQGIELEIEDKPHHTEVKIFM